jgi:hypothetical protein
LCNSEFRIQNSEFRIQNSEFVKASLGRPGDAVLLPSCLSVAIRI